MLCWCWRELGGMWAPAFMGALHTGCGHTRTPSTGSVGCRSILWSVGDAMRWPHALKLHADAGGCPQALEAQLQRVQASLADKQKELSAMRQDVNQRRCGCGAGEGAGGHRLQCG